MKYFTLKNYPGQLLQRLFSNIGVRNYSYNLRGVPQVLMMRSMAVTGPLPRLDMLLIALVCLFYYGFVLIGL